MAQSLESKYGLCTLNVDEIVLAAIKSGDSAKALTARQACAKAMYDKLHPEGKTPEEEAREAGESISSVNFFNSYKLTERIGIFLYKIFQ